MDLLILILSLIELILIIVNKKMQTKLFEEKDDLIKRLKKLIIIFENKVEHQKHLRLQEQHNNELILKENAKLKARIVDLENNIEFLYNNLSAKNKALIEGNKKRNKKRALVEVGNQD